MLATEISTKLETYGRSRAAAQAARCTLSATALLALVLPAAAQTVPPFLPPPPGTVSTVPLNGDVNPYGTVFVPFDNDWNRNEKASPNSVLQPGDLLVSNFNNFLNLQGTGTTIVRIDKHGKQSLFFQGSTQFAGLSAALGVLSDGTVLVGNLKTTDGTSNTVSAGALQIITPAGVLENVIVNPAIDGPWGIAVHERERTVDVFLSNVLNGTIARLTFERGMSGLELEKSVVMVTGLTHRTDPAALVLGPSGLLYDAASDTLYFANSDENAIYTVGHATVVAADEAAPALLVQDLTHLHGPLDLAFAPNGHLLVANSDGTNFDQNQPSEIAEYTREGAFVAQFPVDPNNGGAFGIAVQPVAVVTRLAAVDDNASNVTIYSELEW
jgi:hypothetical protein